MVSKIVVVISPKLDINTRMTMSHPVRNLSGSEISSWFRIFSDTKNFKLNGEFNHVGWMVIKMIT